MKARIRELKDNYYGTNIDILSGPAKSNEIHFWFATGKPSKRQLKKEGYKTIKEAMKDGYPCDSHYECAETYRIAQIIVKALRVNKE